MADIPGTSGDDFLFGTEGDDTIRGFAGNDFILGFGGNDTLDGGDGDDQLVGGPGNDVLLGGKGNDTLAGDTGADTLTGGAGNNKFEWDPFGGTSTTSVMDTVTDFQGAGNAVGDTLELQSFSSSTRLTFGGRLAAMPLPGSSIGISGDGLAAVFYAFSSGNTFVLADTNDNGSYDANDFTLRLTGQHNLVQSDFGSTPFVISGTNGADTINGTEGNDTILALGGNDTVNGRGGNDRIEGGDGNDTVNGGTGDDILIGGNGNDQLNGDAGNDRIDGNDGADILMGGDGIDRITGGAGNDIIDGGAGRDTVLAGGDGNDIVRGGAGNDTLDGDAGNDQLFGGNDNDTLFGGDGNDIMFGDAGNDELFGGFGNDILNGGAGVDEIQGEEGADILTGGAAADQFEFNAGSFRPDSILSLRDQVVDFQGAGVAGGDVIRLFGDSFAFVGNLNVNPTQGAALPGAGDGITQLGYTVRNNNTYLIADSNDNGVLNNDDFVVQFNGVHNFTVNDFDNTDFVIAGTNGDDVITGTEGDDRIFAAGGNDQVFALGGDDEVHGGAGDDVLDGGPGGFDNLFGDAGNDRLTLATSDGGGVASGGDGDDVLFGSNTSFSNFDNSLQGDAGNDDLHAGTVGSSLNGGSGSDRLFSSAADDQMEAGRDASGFDLDNAQDLFVFTGTGRWSAEGSFFGDIISGFQDGSDLFDMRGSGLQFSDLTIVNEDFQTTITSDRGTITIFESSGQEVFVDQNDFLFDPALAPIKPDLLV
jgi:Ca2+-binding RTX toxin-like protein